MRIRTLPLASRTGRITPGITDRISGCAASSVSSTSRKPSIMLCSILRRSLAVRSRILLPTLFAAQRNEAAGRRGTGFEPAAALPDHLQVLVAAFPYRNDEPAGILELIEQRLR